MKKFILITGASSGIGYEMAQQLAGLQFNLILVARNADKLNIIQKTLMSQYDIEVHIFAKDLSSLQAAKDLYYDVKAENFIVSHLVNNAGFGAYGNFLNTDLENEINMINLNVNSLVILTKLFAQDMVERKEGRIMNVASLLSFIPFPYYSVYSATKTFVLAFSETIAEELEDKGVVVSTLCPGPVETPFHTSEMRKTNAMIANKPMPVKVVAREGVNLLLRGKGKKIVGFNIWFFSNLQG